MLLDYSNQIIIQTRVSYSREEQRGDKITVQWNSESHQNNPFNLLEFWALVGPQLVSLSKVQNSTTVNDFQLTTNSRKIRKHNKKKILKKNGCRTPYFFVFFLNETSTT